MASARERSGPDEGAGRERARPTPPLHQMPTFDECGGAFPLSAGRSGLVLSVPCGAHAHQRGADRTRRVALECAFLCFLVHGGGGGGHQG